MSEINRREICEGVSFTAVSDSRFKRERISASLIVPLNKDTAPANALLANVLTRSCREYPDLTTMARKLNSLYGAALYPSVTRRADYQIITIAASGIADRYTYDNSLVSAELARLLCSILFDPKLVDGTFCTEDTEQEQRQLVEELEAEFNDKRNYAIDQCVKVMCADEPYAIGRCGTKEDVARLTPDDLFAAWEKLLDTARVELFMLGSTDPAQAYDGFVPYFKDKPRSTDKKSIVRAAAPQVRRVEETDQISQSKLVMGYRCVRRDDDYGSVANYMTGVVLGGTPISKLFVNVREKQSLCYYCSASLANNKGLLLIDSGVETDQIEKAEKGISEQLSLLQNGELSDEELTAAKLSVKNMYMSKLDSLSSLQSHYLAESFHEKPLSPEELCSIAESVKKEDIIALSNEIKQDTVFSLKGTGGEES